MGLFDKLRNELIDIIEWTDNSTDTIVWKFPRYQNEIKMGAKLIVRESQQAVFLNQGTIADVYKPGMHTLDTRNMPILSTIMGWKYGFNSPFKTDVFFVNTKQFTNQKWGTKNPVMIRDNEFGPLRIRAFGSYAFKIKDAAVFLKSISGTNTEFTVEQINEHLKNITVTRGMDAIAESKIPILDLASQYDEVSKIITEKLKPDFDEIGVEFTKFLVENISLPPEVEAALDKRSSMGIIGNLGAYTQFQAANALEKSAEAGGGAAGMMGAGMGAGMGFGMMNQMGNAFQNNSINPQTGGQMPPPPPPILQFFIAVNGQQTGPFLLDQLRNLIMSSQMTRDTLVWRNGMANWQAAAQVPELSSLFGGSMPPPLPPQ